MRLYCELETRQALTIGPGWNSGKSEFAPQALCGGLAPRVDGARAVTFIPQTRVEDWLLVLALSCSVAFSLPLLCLRVVCNLLLCGCAGVALVVSSIGGVMKPSERVQLICEVLGVKVKLSPEATEEDWAGWMVDFQIPTARFCIECGAKMVERDGKFGKFWGCTRYPECRYTENH